MIYFVQAGRGGPVKIGYARDVLRRVSMLQCNNHIELRLLRVKIGSLRDEFDGYTPEEALEEGPGDD